MYRTILIAAAILTVSATVTAAPVCGAGGLTLVSGCGALPVATEGVNYRATLATAGCTVGTTTGGGFGGQCQVGWTITGLPANLTYQTVTTGTTVITGVPGMPGDYVITINATDMKAAGGACDALATPLQCTLKVAADITTVPPQYQTLGNNQRNDYYLAGGGGGGGDDADSHNSCFAGTPGSSTGVGTLAALLALAAMVGLAVRR
jgi:hypothetical protein